MNSDQSAVRNPQSAIKSLRVLIVEDSEDDTLLLVRELRKGGYGVTYERVETSESMNTALERQWDLIVADYMLPAFSGLAALEILKEQKMDVPFIIVSGNIGEDIAVAAMKAGAHDYIIKGNLKRLVPAVERELRDADVRRERRKAAEAVKTERQRFYDVLEMLPVYVVLLTPDYNVPFANRFFRERFGESHGKHCFEYLFGRNEPCETCETYTVLKTNAPHHWEWTGSDGRNYDIFDYPFTDWDGSPLIMEMGIDITERKQAEKELKEANETLEQRVAERTAELVASEARLARAQEIAHLGGWELDLVKNALTWSDEVYRIFGLQPQEFGATYEAFLERVLPADRAAVDAAYSSSIREEKDSYEIEHRVVRKDTREVRWVQEKCQHVRDEAGMIIRSIGMVLDITERKRAEEELRKLTEDLKHSNSDLEQFAYIASHDLQSPLRNVEGFVKMLARRYRGQLDEKADEFIHYISTGVKDMQTLILDILEYSKVGSDGSIFSNTDLSLCIAKALSNLHDEIAEKNADITMEEPFPTVFGDSTQLTSLFQNLIGNAIKFCTDTPKIHLSAKKEGREYIFSVRDNGIGIDPKDSGKIFAVFHRLHSKSEYPGTGIGLAICNRITERHKGRMWVESEPGKGSTFYFTLPIMELRR